MPLPAALGDTALPQQVWVNLIGNAINCTRILKTAEIEIGASTAGTEGVYYIRDNGAGV